MKDTYRIAIVSPQIVGIGQTPQSYSSQQINLAKYWAKKGCFVDVITGPCEGLGKALSYDGIRLVKRPVLWIGGRNGLPVMFGVFRYLSRGNYDVIFSSEHYQPVTCLSCLVSKNVVIYQGHNTSGSSPGRRLFFKILERIVLPVVRRRYRLVIAKTNAANKFVKKRGLERCITIPCGYDSTRFYPPSLEDRLRSRKFLNITDDEKVLVYAGNLLPRRDVGTAVKTLAKLRKSGLNAVLAIAGSGPEYKNLINLARQENVLPYTKFLGHLDWIRLRNLYWAGDIFIFPTHYEIFGLVLLEALACGLKILSTPCPAAIDIMTKCPDAGAIVPVGDVDAFSEKALRLFPGESRERYMSASIKAFLKCNDWDSIANKILELIRGK